VNAPPVPGDDGYWSSTMAVVVDTSRQ